jgi:hypothetical protein
MILDCCTFKYGVNNEPYDHRSESIVAAHVVNFRPCLGATEVYLSTGLVRYVTVTADQFGGFLVDALKGERQRVEVDP